MHLAVRPTTPALAPFVRSLWYFTTDDPPGRELALPTGAMQLFVNLHADELHAAQSGRLSGAALHGAQSGPVVIDTADQRAIVGVAFKPGGAYPFLPAPASTTTDELVELSELWGRDGAVLRERLLSARSPAEMLRTLERVLLARVARPLQPDPTIAFGLRAFERGASVAAVSHRVGMTSKSFARRFVETVGLTPKRFSRVRRFQRLITAVTAGDETDWAQRAAAFGYYDQSHLIHDFRALSGLCPGQYRPRSNAERNHVALPAPAA